MFVMVAYTVFPFKPSGSAPVFAFIECDTDESAISAALSVLAEHPSSVRVALWRENELVFSGLSAGCVAWLTEAPERIANCPQLTSSGLPCPPSCGRCFGPTGSGGIVREKP
jgi:hypothetical protein